MPCRNPPFALLLLLLGLALPAPAFCARLFLFGDSLLDTGNSLYPPLNNTERQPKANFPPYGINFSPAGPTGRWTDGKVFSDLLADKLGIPTPPPALQPGANFTNGTNLATVGGVSYFYNLSVTTFNLDSQVSFLRDLITNGLTPAIDDIVMMTLGSNDLLVWLRATNFFRWGGQSRRVAASVAASSIKTIRDVYNLGFKNIIVANVPPLGCLPVIRAISSRYLGNGCLGAASSPATRYNKNLNDGIKALRNEFKDAKILVLNINVAFTKAVRDAGLKTNDPACCGGPPPIKGVVQCGKPGATTCSDPSRAVYWDSIHPTSSIVKRVFDYSWNSTNAYIQPMNISSLFRMLGLPILN